MNLRELTSSLRFLGYDGLKARLTRHLELSRYADQVRVSAVGDKGIIRYFSDDGAGDAWSIWLDDATATALIVAFDHESDLSFYPDANYKGQADYFKEVPEQFEDFIYGLSQDDEYLLLPIVTQEGSVISATLVITLQGKTVTVSKAYEQDVAAKNEDGGIWLLEDLIQDDLEVVVDVVRDFLRYEPDIIAAALSLLKTKDDASRDKDKVRQLVLDVIDRLPIDE